MITFDLHGAHSGDLLLALPVMQGLKNAGMQVAVCMEDRHYSPVASCGIPNTPCPRNKKLRPYIGHGTHRTVDWLARMKRLGFNVTPAKTQFDMRPNKDLLPGDGWVLLQPWCEWDLKHWSIDKWKLLASTLVRIGHKVAVGGPLCFRNKADSLGVANICGMDSGDWLRTVAAAEFVVSVDSGAAHAADALGVRNVSLYGNAMPVHVWHPYWDQGGVIAKDHINDITVEEVIEKLHG